MITLCNACKEYYSGDSHDDYDCKENLVAKLEEAEGKLSTAYALISDLIAGMVPAPPRPPGRSQ